MAEGTGGPPIPTNKVHLPADKPQDKTSSGKQPKCVLNSDECVSLKSILQSFNSPINEQQAWALCYQSAKCAEAVLEEQRECLLADAMEHIMLHKDGHVHASTFLLDNESSSASNGASCSGRIHVRASSEGKLMSALALVVFRAFNYGAEEEEERPLNPELEQLLDLMISAEEPSAEERAETDDEGIEQDSGDSDEDEKTPPCTWQQIRQRCEAQGFRSGCESADVHFRAVCRALVAEALELSNFLEKVTEGSGQLQHLRRRAEAMETGAELEKLDLADWAKFWVQVMRDLRNGVKLKKTEHQRLPIEYELTPYEILMDDIRSRRYKLRQVPQQPEMPARIRKDAHAVILEFIRSRPPLRKASERRLRPARKVSTPVELLMESIRQHDHRGLRPTKSLVVPNASALTAQPATPLSSTSREEPKSNPGRRLIPADFASLLPNSQDDENDDLADVESPSPSPTCYSPISDRDESLETPLGEQVPPRPLSCQPQFTRTCIDDTPRRHSLAYPTTSLHSLASSQPASRAHSSSSSSLSSGPTSCPLPSSPLHSVQEEFLASKHFQRDMDCIALTLEELMHIRNVLTKAELESLPLDMAVKQDAAKGKVCFLCMKTRFGLFGPWAHICRLCKRNVCSKCCSKMRIPTEHFATIPVSSLSPTSPPPTSSSQLAQWSITELFRSHGSQESLGPAALCDVGMSDETDQISRSNGATSSAPVSPALTRRKMGSLTLRPQTLWLTSSVNDSQRTLSRQSSIQPRRKSTLIRTLTLAKTDADGTELMTVCRDCKTMIVSIVQNSRQRLRRLSVNSDILDTPLLLNPATLPMYDI